MHTVTLCVLSIVSTDLTLLRIHAQVKNTHQLVTFSNVEILNNTHLCTECSSCCSCWRFALHVLSNLCSLTETEPDNLLHTENINNIALVAHKI